MLLAKSQLISELFKRIAMDLVGQIIPASSRGNHYILMTIDYAMRFTDEVLLWNIKIGTVAETLFGIWSQVGVLSEILTNQGTQFVGSVRKR